MLKKLSDKPIFCYLFSFFIPFFVILIALNGLHIVPFGDNTLIISDANGLYVNYLGYVGRLIKGMEGFTYSFEKGLGGNMMPHMSGTMSNPLFALIALFLIHDYPLAFTLISVLSFCICGFTMYLLLADIYGHRRSNLIFSTSYALSGFLVANVFQIIFFPACQILPLMVLGLRKIVQGKNPLLYIFSLVYIMFNSFYSGFMICVASVLFFFTALWLMEEDLKGRKLSVFCNYTISSLCGGLIPILVWLPAFMGLMGGRLDQTKISDFSFREKMPFLEIFSKLFTGANTTSQLVNGLPNIFVGLLPVALVILFFMNKKITRRGKAAAGFLLGFYLLGFYIIAFDMLLHGGTRTNWFNFRYSYIFSFLLLLIAAYEWQYVDELSFRELKNCFVGMIVAALIVFSKCYEYVMGSEVVLDFALLLLIFLAYRMYRLKPESNPKHTFETVTILIVCFSLFLNYTISTKNILLWEHKASEYQEVVNAVDPLVSAITQNDLDFYRMEINKQRTGNVGNDPMLYGYNGVGHGGSNERDFVRQELSKLGVQWYDMRAYYAQGIPAATDALLGLRYLIANEDVTEEKAYIRLTDMAKMGLGGEGDVFDAYKSPYALPIAFVAEAGVNALELDHEDIFENLNQVWLAVSGEQSPVFIEESEIFFRSVNLADTEEMDAAEAREIVRSYQEKSEQSGDDLSVSGSTEGSTSEEDARIVHPIMEKRPEFASSVEFSFTVAQDGPVYVYHRTALSNTRGSAEPVMKYMGYYHKGETVTGYLYAQGDYVNRIAFEEYAGKFRAAYADLDTLQRLSEIVRERPSTLEKIKDSHLRGTVTLEEGQELLFTIPWDEGWTCTVDGQPVALTKVLGVFMAAELSPGEHSYEMKYVPEGLNIGMKISAAAFVLMLVYLLFGRKWMDRISVKKQGADMALQDVQLADREPETCPDEQSLENLSCKN